MEFKETLEDKEGDCGLKTEACCAQIWAKNIVLRVIECKSEKSPVEANMAFQSHY